MLFSTPEYAGTLPGSFKNLLDGLHRPSLARDMVESGIVASLLERDALARWWATMHGQLEKSE
jgi:NAD(P)H-dependent FMN reductase